MSFSLFKFEWSYQANNLFGNTRTCIIRINLCLKNTCSVCKNVSASFIILFIYYTLKIKLYC